jgi:hypothetical protein
VIGPQAQIKGEQRHAPSRPFSKIFESERDILMKWSRDHVLTWCFNDKIYVDFTDFLTVIEST